MMRLASTLVPFLLAAAAVDAANVLIADKAEARAYIDQSFAANDCRMTKAAFFSLMEQDGVAPTVDDMSRPMDGSLKIIRQRMVLASLKELFETGQVCEDHADARVAISKFGGCAR